MSRGIEGVKVRLRDQRREIETLERRLSKAKKRRGLLIAKLRTAGLSLRAVADIAGISNPRISQEEAAARKRVGLARRLELSSAQREAEIDHVVNINRLRG